MIRVTIDMYSGRENPVYYIDDASEARALLRGAGAKSLLSHGDAPDQGGLGLRGFAFEAATDEVALGLDFEDSAYLRVDPQTPSSAQLELVERLATVLRKGGPDASATDAAGPADDPLDYLEKEIATAGGATTVADQDESDGTETLDAAEDEAGLTDVTCYIELGRFNPGFWNNNATTRRRNNCYNYASNWRTNTFAQPGRGSGAMYTALNCAEVTRAALSDGMHRRFDCFPPSERPRYLTALVIWPGRDYHWYRKHQNNFWGHKPGQTAARNTDNSNRIIRNPRTCDRGPYTQFCGYFYGCNSQRRRIR